MKTFEIETLFKVWKRGRAAARTWQYDWRDGARQQTHQGSWIHDGKQTNNIRVKEAILHQ